MDWLMEFSGWFITGIIIVVAYFTGSRDEKKHYESILRREEELRHIMLFSVKRPPKSFTNQKLVRGSVVISSNAFTRMLSGFRNFFGGKMSSYETLLDRARREAILRMKQEANDLGADMIMNMKIETATLGNIHDPRQQGAQGTVEVLVYGTAGNVRKKQAA